MLDAQHVCSSAPCMRISHVPTMTLPCHARCFHSALPFARYLTWTAIGSMARATGSVGTRMFQRFALALSITLQSLLIPLQVFQQLCGALVLP